MSNTGVQGVVRKVFRSALSLSAASTLLAGHGAAQTDYYNPDAGRPVRVEDAYPVERYAFELQAAPVRFERADNGLLELSVEPELAYGLLPRTQVEVAFPLSVRTGGGSDGRYGLGGVELSMLHNLNVESESFPAFALAADVVLPVGERAPTRAYPSLKGIATRTYPFARLHLNGKVTAGPSPRSGPALTPRGGATGETSERAEGSDFSRWMAGVAIDRALPLRSTLLIVDLFAERPMGSESEVEWTAEAGLRYQLSPFFSLDAGVGRRFAGADRGWLFTVGAARAFAIRSLISMPPQ